jgi:hypothetical protein
MYLSIDLLLKAYPLKEAGRLGHLAGTFEDGSLQIFAVPIPAMVGHRTFGR